MSLVHVKGPVWSLKFSVGVLPEAKLSRSETRRLRGLTLGAFVVGLAIFAYTCIVAPPLTAGPSPILPTVVSVLYGCGLIVLVALAVSHIYSYLERRLWANANQRRDSDFRDVVGEDLARLCDQIDEGLFPLKHLAMGEQGLVAVFDASGFIGGLQDVPVGLRLGEYELFSYTRVSEFFDRLLPDDPGDGDAITAPSIQFDGATWVIHPLPKPNEKVTARINVTTAVVWVEDPESPESWPALGRGVMR